MIAQPVGTTPLIQSSTIGHDIESHPITFHPHKLST